MAQRLAMALLAAFVAISCGGPVDPSKNVTEPPFSGTVQPGGIGVPTPHFTVSNLGEAKVILTALTPGNVYIGIGWGQWGGNSCGLFAGQTNVITSANIGKTVLNPQIFTKGDYCVVLFDATNLGAPPLTVAQNFTIEVSHP